VGFGDIQQTHGKDNKEACEFAGKALKALGGGTLKDDTILQCLRLIHFRPNYKRAEVRPQGQPAVFSMTLGLVGQPPRISPTTEQLADVSRLIGRWGHQNLGQTAFKWTSICPNKDYSAVPHRDNNSEGLTAARALGVGSGGGSWPCGPGTTARSI
jgi:hypothetical protein